MGFEFSGAHRHQERTSGKENGDTEGRRTDQDLKREMIGADQEDSHRNGENGLERQSELKTAALGV